MASKADLQRLLPTWDTISRAIHSDSAAAALKQDAPSFAFALALANAGLSFEYHSEMMTTSGQDTPVTVDTCKTPLVRLSAQPVCSASFALFRGHMRSTLHRCLDT